MATHAGAAESASVVFHQHGLKVTLSAPQGWVIENAPHTAERYQPVLYPKGSSWEKSDVIMYLTAAEIPAGQSARAGVDRLLTPARANGFKESGRSALPIGDGRRAEVLHLTAPDGRLHRIAVIEEPAAVAAVVLTAMSPRTLKGAEGAFASVVGSYRAEKLAPTGARVTVHPMTDTQLILFLVGAAFFVVGLWAFVCVLAAFLGGWRRLARSYRATRPFHGPVWRWQTGALGAFGYYRNSLRVGADASGLHLAAILPFSLGHPPLFFPWDEMTVTRGSHLWWRYLEFGLRRSRGHVQLSAKLEERLRQAAGAAWPGGREAA